MGAKNCPETPRQQMIGMMYLVLTAMLALNVAKDILDAFNVVDDTLIQSNKNVKTALDDRYENLLTVSGDELTAAIEEAQGKAKELRKSTDEMVKYIETLRWDLTKDVDGENASAVVEAQKNAKHGEVPCVPVDKIEAKDNFDKPTHFMLGTNEGHDANCPAQVLKKKINDYKKGLKKFYTNDQGIVDKSVEAQLASLNTNDHQTKDGPVRWEIYNFDHLITAGTVILLSKMVSEVKSAEAVVLNYIISRAGSANLSFAEYAGHSIAESKVLFSGDSYKSTVIVAAFDPAMQLDVYYKVGVDSLSEAEEGSAIHESGPATGVPVEIAGGGVGTHKIAGYVKVINPNTGKAERYHFKDEYVVVPKGGATISADKMNVLYAGIKNPVTAAGGSDASKLTVSFPGCQVQGSGASRNVIPPTSMIGRTVEATVTTSEGSAKMTFRVKKVPDPYAQIGANIFGGKKSKAELAANPMLIAKMSEDFAFDLKWTVQSYSVDVIEKGIITTINCSGSAFSQQLRDKINGASAGTVFMFSNIKISQPELGTRTMPRDITVRIK
ncbi:MAG: hypothetical protein MJZ70_00625 [Bacteroidales bacterium]|nr:hypothetical protein [Bacteroidales bacterium]